MKPIRWILALVTCLMVATCNDPTSAPGLVQIRLQLNWVPEPEFGGIYAAEFDGLFREAGLEVEIIKDPGGAAVQQMIAQGVCDAGIVSGDQLLQFREQGGDLVAIYSVFDHTPYGIMVHAAGAPETLKEVWQGTGILAIESGLPIWKFVDATYGASTRKQVPYGGAIAQFLSDPTLAQQCFVTSEPPLMDIQKVPVKVFSVSDIGFDPYSAVVAIRRDGMKPEVQKKFVEAMQKGWQRYMANPAQYNPRIAALNPAMAVEAMNLGAKRMQPLLLTPWTAEHGMGSMNPARWQAMIDVLHSAGVIKTRPDPAVLMQWPLASTKP